MYIVPESEHHQGNNPMGDCIFCRIAVGALRAEVVYEDGLVMAISDICPIRPGHTLIIPRRHFEYFEALPDDTAGRLIHVGQRLSRAMKVIYGVPRVGFLLTGGDHAHVHAHVVPMQEKTDITSRRYIAEECLTFRPLQRATDAELSAAATALRAELERH
jgi:histidine triad (HIT) family protein